jgi:uncharacterized protein YgbK (DUF1537 family)
MIAVIADDFTGAAEIGGIALKYGLKVIIETKVKKVSDADLLIIATDTRSLSVESAMIEIEKITNKLIKLNPQFIYKKLDSVLRGNIASELLAQMSASGKKRALIIAGNPIFGRHVKNGIYLINEIPLSETHFANDPDFLIKSSSVIEILNNEKCTVVSKNVDEVLPKEGVIIGDVNSIIDMQKWNSKIDETTIAAGGAGFFDVILSSRFAKLPYPKYNVVQSGKRTLFVFGSAFPKSIGVVQRLGADGVVKKYMPEEIYKNKNFELSIFENWVAEVIECLHDNQKTIISVDFNYSTEDGLPFRIKKTIAKLVKRVMQEVKLDDLFIEGGATTSAILNSLKIAKLFPFRELELGIIQLRVDEYPNLCITTKPGSYLWPKNISFENVENQLKVG